MEIKIINNKKAKILAAIVDWDGTISLLREGWNKVMKDYIANYISLNPQKKDLLWAENFIKETMGENTVDQMLGMMAKAHENGVKNMPIDQKKRKNLAEKQRIKYRKSLEEKMRSKRIKRAKVHPGEFINKGIKKFLQELKKRNVKIFVISGSEQKERGGIEEEVEILKLKHYFEKVFGYNGQIHPYTKENALKWIIKKYKIKNPLQILVVGDGPKEIKTGRDFGTITIGLVSNNLSKKNLLKSGADYIVYNPTDLVDCLNYIDLGSYR